MIKTHYIWTEKYRPQNLDLFIGNDLVKGKIGRMISTGDIPHLLFAGGPGTGKTTLAKIIVKNIECDFLYVNASDENSVDAVRNKIKTFASSVGFKPLKVIILDEADFITPQAQAALRNLMETFSKTTRFILTCNYQERLIDALISRTQQFRIEPPSKTDVARHLVQILDKENTQFQISDVKLLIDAYYPDIRKVINEAQLHSTVNSKLEVDPEEVIDGDIKLKIIEILKQRGNTKERFNEVRQLVADADIRDFAQYYSLLFSEIDKYAGDKISQIILFIAEGMRWDGLCLNKNINFNAMIATIIGELG